MSAPRKEEQAAAMIRAYEQGRSVAQVAELFGVTRQSAHKMMARRGVKFRQAEPRPFVMWRGDKYTLRDNGYYGKTTGIRSYLHRDMWEAVNGPIPPGHDVHHKNEDKTDNRIENFDLHTQSEHGTRHGFGGNQHTGSLGRRPVKW